MRPRSSPATSFCTIGIPRTNDVTYGGDILRILGFSEAEMAGGLSGFVELHPPGRPTGL